MSLVPVSESIESHALAIHKSSPSKSIAQRLADGCPTAKEREELELTAQITACEDAGLTRAKQATRLGMTKIKLEQFVQSEKYRVYRKFLAEQQATSEDDLSALRRQESRRRFDKHDQNALRYFDQAFKTADMDELDAKGRVIRKKGDFLDLDRAERASLLVAKAQGWTEPLPTVTKPKELKGGVIQQAMQAIAAADRRETVVRITQTIEVGSRETGSMGDG
jgi:hypothetical protein